MDTSLCDDAMEVDQAVANALPPSGPFQRLPTEIVLSIADQCRFMGNASALGNLSLTCSRFQAIISPVLAGMINPYGIGRNPHPKTDPLQLYPYVVRLPDELQEDERTYLGDLQDTLNMLVECPSIIKYLHRVGITFPKSVSVFHGRQTDERILAMGDRAMLYLNMLPSQTIEDYNHASGWTAILLLLAKNLRHLRIVGDFSDRGNLGELTYLPLLTEMACSPKSFQRLQMIELSNSNPSATYKTNSDIWRMAPFVRYFRFTNLAREPLTPLPSLPQGTRLDSLVLTSTDLAPAALESLFRQVPTLRMFCYNYSTRFEAPTGNDIHRPVQEYVNSIASASSHLEELTLEFPCSRGGNIMRHHNMLYGSTRSWTGLFNQSDYVMQKDEADHLYMGRISYFGSLKVLTTRSYMIHKPNGVSELGFILPRSLEVLTLKDDHLDAPGFEDAVADLVSAKPTRFRHLREIKLLRTFQASERLQDECARQDVNLTLSIL